MQLFELVSPRLFRPLAGPNRAFYAELLLLLWEECRQHNIQVVFSHVNEQPMSVFEKAGFCDEVGREYFRPNIDAALEYAETL